jgi:hypothetical protein
MTPEEKAVVQAAINYYWHESESVDWHNDLMDAVRALDPEDPDTVRDAGPVWVAATLADCLAGDRIRIGSEQTTVNRASRGIWHADTRDEWRPRAWEHVEVRLDLEAVKGPNGESLFQPYPPATAIEILCTPERQALLTLSQAFPGSEVVQ